MYRESVADAVESMLEYVEKGTTFSTPRLMEVPAASYTDPQQWQREMERIFARVPLMLALSCELPKPGDYKAMEAVGRPVLITRDKDGRVHAFLNVCAHRGAPVAEDGHGNCARFTCPYHGWTFANDGRLIAVADREKFGELDKAGRGLTELPAREKNGLIFVVLTPGAAIDVDRFYGRFLDDYEALGVKDWTFYGSRVIEGANWKVAYDGYLEGYHFAQLHPQTINPRTFSNVTHYEASGPHLRIGFPQRSIGKLREVPKERWGELENDGFDFVRILFPNVSIFVAPEVTQIAQLFPGPTPDRNRTVLLYAGRKAPADAAEKERLEGMINFFRDVTYGEDYVLGMKIQKGLESGALKSVVFGRNERGNQYFHEWVDWYLANDPARPTPTL
jgi:phenylpropionate dioxygenase-like ring-hydroxylating dioxygenase large terminal subunit